MSLIHFTSSFDRILSILEDNSLRIAYSKEDFIVGKRIVSSAVHPMVCFSEFEQYALSESTITYGRYGVEFSLDWARRKKISPVMYVNENSMAATGLATLLRARRRQVNEKLPRDLSHAIMQLKCFTKNERGYNKFLNKHNFIFKKENEWRYVPNKSDIGGGLISQDKSEYLKNPDYYNEKLLPYVLKFRKIDIQSIYVSNNHEVNELLKELPDLKIKIKISNWNVNNTEKMNDRSKTD